MNALGQEARALIDSTSKLDEPTPADKARVRARISAELGAAVFATLTVSAAGSGAIATGAAPAAEASAGSARAALDAGAHSGVAHGATWPVLSKLALSGAALTLVAGALWLGAEGSDGAREAPTKAMTKGNVHLPQARAAAEQASADPAAAERGQPSDLVLAQPARLNAAPVKSGRGAAQRKSAAAPEPTVAPQASTLGAELKMLGEAQAALRGGAPERALALAAEHRASYPAGVMKEERDGIEVLAGCALGHDYRAQAEAFLRSAQSSPLKARVRKACGIEP